MEFRLWANAGLVHTRLSIIDLSPAGAQPITNEDRTVWVVFNGEIYNHKELRRDLESPWPSIQGLFGCGSAARISIRKTDLGLSVSYAVCLLSPFTIAQTISNFGSRSFWD